MIRDLTQLFKVCPICGTHAAKDAAYCSTCGNSLHDVGVSKGTVSSVNARGYDRRFGETDLLEGDSPRTAGMYVVSTLLVLAVIACVAVVGISGIQFLGSRIMLEGVTPSVADVISPNETTDPLPQPTLTLASPLAQDLVLATNTSRPTMALHTVTPAPPTATPTPTPGPCTRRVQAGDDLITLAYGCGHRSLDIIPAILELNNLDAPERIIVGQEILIPWPTATEDPNAAASGSSGSSEASANDPARVAAANVPDSGPTETPEPTLRPTETLLPGIMWHVVQPNESMVSIAFQYSTNAEVLSQLNPEIAFSQCDFGSDTGGPRCTVLLGQGQRVRVPAPSPTPTLSPTLSGSETPTPTATATFNAPSALGPNDRALFLRDDLITLRWVTSGALATRDVYRITMTDETTGTTFQADTRELYFIVPSEWQGSDARLHTYTWTISVLDLSRPDAPIYITEPRTFSWEARGERN